jgi:hypothetical protein
VVKNIYTSKLAEWAINQFMRDYMDAPLIRIDFRHYDVDAKSWKPDLPYYSDYAKLWDIHVKSVVKYKNAELNWTGITWTFNYSNSSGSGGKDHLFNNGSIHDVIALAVVKTDDLYQSNEVAVYGFLPWSEIEPLLEPPKLEELKDIKKCIYWETIIKKLGEKSPVVV